MLVPAGTKCFPLLAREAEHIRSRATYILYNAFEFRHLRHPGHFVDDRSAAPALDDPALVMGEGAERACAKTSTVTRYRELHGFQSGDLGVVRGVCPPAEWVFVDMIELFSFKRECGGILDDDRFWVRLNYGFSPNRILLIIVLGECTGIRGFIL